MRRFVLLACLMTVSGVLGAQPFGTADLVLVNGRIYTVDAARPWAEAVAIAGDRILAVGTSAEVRALVGSRTRTIDLRGMFASPGFNDAHVHIDSRGRCSSASTCSTCTSPVRFAIAFATQPSACRRGRG